MVIAIMLQSGYLLSRLPSPADDGGDAPLRTLIGRSFAAFRARKRGDAEWIENRIASVSAARKQLEPPDADQWLDRVSGLTGVSVGTLRELCAIFDDPQHIANTIAAVDALLAWLNANPAKLLELVRPENVQGLFGAAYEKLATDDQRGRHALPVIESMLKRWLAGEQLNMIAKSLSLQPSTVGTHKAKLFAKLDVSNLMQQKEMAAAYVQK